MKLQSLREFVLNEEKKFDSNKESWAIDYLTAIFRYTQLLSQPLQLGFFAPCDLEGNTLNIIPFNEHKRGSDFEFEQHEIYREAKERVLFEGLEITHFEGRLSGKNNLEFETVKGGFYWDLVNKKFMIEGDIYDDELKTIEDLVGFDLTLTESAITKIKGV